MRPGSLSLLNADDWRLLLEKAESRVFEGGETILDEGSPRRALHVVRRGFVRVERAEQGQRVTVATLGSGETFGEMALLEESGASASVLAQDRVEVDIVAGNHIETLLTSMPGFSARFYQSLALSLSRRLRETTTLLSQLNVNDVAQVNRFHMPRTGQITERQIPEELARSVTSFRSRLQEIDGARQAQTISDEAAQAAVSESCDALVELLRTWITSDALTELGYADLLSFRDQGHLEVGVGVYIFREAFPWLMASTLIARCYMKPRGYAEDFETAERIEANDPEGDGRLGPLVDGWFLSRPFCRARRASRSWLQDRLLAKGAGGEPLAVTSLASGTAREILEAARALPGLRATCIDIDDHALVQGAARAARASCGDRVLFIRGNVLRLSALTLSLPPQDMISSLGLTEYLDDAQVVAILDWAYERLAPGGEVVLSNVSLDPGERAFMEHILEWRLNQRDPEALQALLRRSRFGGGEVEDGRDGATHFACGKRR
jgi:extracellular factor (EF) 3-hydroxypalmitic acid methyl ester biosynthesis protein